MKMFPIEESQVISLHHTRQLPSVWALVGFVYESVLISVSNHDQPRSLSETPVVFEVVEYKICSSSLFTQSQVQHEQQLRAKGLLPH